MDNDLLIKILERIAAIEKVQYSIEEKLTELIPLKEDVSKIKLDVNTIDNKLKQHEKELEELKENTKWLRRLVIGGFVTVASGLILALLKGSLGI
jgi:uncharacterized membrane protein YjjP (DUF1212 family)